MIFRLSTKLATKLKVTSSKVLPLNDNPFADWSGHDFTAEGELIGARPGDRHSLNGQQLTAGQPDGAPRRQGEVDGGQGFWLCQKRRSRGRFGWWPTDA